MCRHRFWEVIYTRTMHVDGQEQEDVHCRVEPEHRFTERTRHAGNGVDTVVEQQVSQQKESEDFEFLDFHFFFL